MSIWPRCLLPVLGIVLCSAPSNAIYESQAGVIDWHHAWVGKSRWAAPIGTSRLVVGTERNVLASLDTESGDIVWRQALDHPVNEFHATATGVLTLSEASVAQFWNSMTGQLVWERALDGPGKAAVALLDDAVIADKSKLVRTSQNHLVWEAPLNSAVVAVQVQDQVVYLVQRSDTSFIISTFNYEDGQLQSTVKLSTVPMADNVHLLGRFLVWTEKDTVKWNELGSKKVHKTSVLSLVAAIQSFSEASPETVALAPGSDDVMFLSAYNLGHDALTVATAAFRVNEKGIDLIEDMGVQESFGAVDASGSQVGRFSKHSQNNLVLDLLSRERLNLKHDFALTGDVAYAKLISVEPLRAFVVMESGSTFLYGDGGSLRWSRDEAMAHVTDTEFMDLPERQLTQLADVEEEVPAAVSPYIRYWHRLQAHVLELQRLPAWILSRYAPAKPKSTPDMQQGCFNGTTPTNLFRDNFGLRKLLISATSTGQVIARDSSNAGVAVWSRYFGNVHFDHVVAVRSVSVKLPPLVVVIGHSGGAGYEETHFYRLNALTGEDYVASSLSPEMQLFFDPQLITETRIAKVMRLPIEEAEEHTHILALYEAGSSRVYIYPDTESARQSFQAYLEKFYFVQQSTGSFKGYQVHEGFRGSLTAQPVWTFDIPKDESVVAVSERQSYEKVALLGRVLGNRNVMYKYLNPHMFAVITTQPQRNTLTVRLIDGVKGTVLYETVHHNVDAVKNPVHVVQAEHWVVYHFFSNDSRNKGYQAVVLELYEGEYQNERIASSNFSSFDNVRPYIQSSAYSFPYAVQSTGVTITRNGVSTKDILFGLTSNQIMGVNKRFLDPRRPKDKPSKEEQEEGLIPYSPIPDERQLFLTYSLEVLGIKRIITTPTLLESTSVVFAYGLDTFFTQSSPSRQFDVLSEDFSKSQLIMTIVGLVVAIAIAGPMVRRKRVNALWQ
ncbi:hypothetical protein BJV82DRAFT_670011 [Fennellomyces sp. T-0311]|nr:hypothetical protein BJV82DRAFT_670011 [Fennellomyces sp. T-0311]